MTQLTRTERETEALRKFVHVVAGLDSYATNDPRVLNRVINDAKYLVRALRVPRTTSGGNSPKTGRFNASQINAPR